VARRYKRLTECWGLPAVIPLGGILQSLNEPFGFYLFSFSLVESELSTGLHSNK
jgi:hypothetical protein